MINLSEEIVLILYALMQDETKTAIKTGTQIAWSNIQDAFSKNKNIEDYGINLSDKDKQDIVNELNIVSEEDISSKENFEQFINNNTHIKKITQNINNIIHNGSGDNIGGNKYEKHYHYNTAKEDTQQILTHLPAVDVCLGRDEDLGHIKKKLEASQPLLLLNGIGGIGKSTLAIQYAHTNKGIYNHIAFIEQNDDIKSSFVNALKGSFELKALSIEDSFKELFSKLQNLDGKNLLIVDNLFSGFEHIKDLQSDNLHLLITSREKLDTTNIYEITKLTEENAIKLFKEYHQDIENEDIIAILNYLDYHTLFIEIVAKTLNSLDYLTSKDILEKFENKQFPQIKTDIQDKNCFNDFLKELFKINNLQDEELLLLQRISLFPSLDLSFDTLVDYLCIEDKHNFNAILNNINKKAWITKNKKSYKLHQIIKDFLIENHKIQYNQCEDIIISFYKKLYLDPGSNPVERSKYLPFVSSILDEIKDKEKNIEILYNNISTIYQAMGELKKALAYQEKSLQLLEEILGEQHPDLATSYNNLSTIYQDMGESEKALEYQEKALELTKEAFGEKHPDLATNYNNLSTIYQDMGESEKALEYQEKALELTKEAFGEKHPDLATNYNNLSMTYRDMGKLEKALEYQKKALKLAECLLGEKHPNVISSYSNLSLIYKNMGKLEKALEYQEKALKLTEEILGEKHPSLATSYNNISLIYQDMGKLEKALEYQEKALKLREEILEEKHPNLATSYNNISMIYKNMGELEKAKMYINKAIVILKYVFPNGHPNLDTLLQNKKIINT